MTKLDLRIATVDIETFPIEAYVWDLFDQNVGLEQIKTEWTIASFCWKWYNPDDPSKGQIIYEDTRGKNVRDDSKLLKSLHTLLDEVDVVIAQNGKAFDVKKINARFIEAGFTPPSPYRVIDTLLESRSIAKFTSNRLAWLSEHLTDTPKSEHKAFPGFSLWKECLANNIKAWEEMKKYNIIDVEATEKVYIRLRPWIKNHPTVKYVTPSVQTGECKPLCPKCGSDNLENRGFVATNNGRKLKYRCRACKGYAYDKRFENTLDERRAMLVSK